MKKVYLTIAMVFLSFSIAGCNSIGDELQFAGCLARDGTSNPCN